MEEFLPLDRLLNPSHRIWYGYLLSSFFIAVIFFLLTKHEKKTILSHIFHKKVWLSKSTGFDISMLVLNYWIKLLLVLPLLLSEVELILKLRHGLRAIFPNYEAIHLSQTTYVLLYSLIFFLVADFSRFYIHYIFHRFAFLWELHKVHHSATVMTPFTLYRAHPIESIGSFFRQLIVTTLVAGTFTFFFNGNYQLTTIFGVQALGFIFNFVASNLRHSHVPVSFGRYLETIFISPVMHQMHHSISRDKNSKNLGSCLTIWDKLWNSYRRPDFKPIRFGLPRNQRKNKSGWAQVLLPYRRANKEN